MSVLLFDTFNGCSSPIKETNRLIWNGMLSKVLRKTDVLKTSIFSERKFEKIHFLSAPLGKSLTIDGTSVSLNSCDALKRDWKELYKVLKSKKLQGILGETFILALSSSAFFRVQNRVSEFFYIVLFVR